MASKYFAFVSLIILVLLLFLPDTAAAQCTPPAQSLRLIAVDAGARRDTTFFGRGPTATTGIDTFLCERELPPMPPQGVFDLRFANPPGHEGIQPPAGFGQGTVHDYRPLAAPSQIDTFRVRFQPGLAGYPMTFSWSPAALMTVCDSARLMDEFGGGIYSVAMLTTGSLAVTNPAINSLLLFMYGIPQPLPAPALVAPADGAVGQPVAVSLTWNAVAGALRYTVQLSADSLFGTLIVNDTSVTGTSRSAGGLSPAAQYFWRVRAANGAGPGAWSVVRRFTTMALAAVPQLVAPSNGMLGVTSGTLLRWTPASGATAYHVQLATDSLFGALVINDASVTDTVRAASPLAAGTLYFWRVAGVNGAGESGWSAVRRFTSAGIITNQYPVTGGWNMISLPLAVADGRRTVVYPSAITSAFAFGSTGYYIQDSLHAGAGYWLKFPSAGTVPITGVTVTLDTLELQAGWNLIGVISVPVDSGSIQQVPAGLLSSAFFSFSGGYTAVTTLEPGAAYWVKASSAGQIVLQAGARRPVRLTR